MSPRERVRHPPIALFRVKLPARNLGLVLLCSFLIITAQMHAQQLGSSGAPVLSVDAVANSSTSDDTEKDSNPRVVAEPAWLITSDSAGNVDQRINLRSDFAVGEHVRLGLMLGQAFVYNTLANSPARTEQIHEAGVIGQWQPNQVFTFNGMVGVSQLNGTVTDGEQAVRQAVILVTNLQLHIAPSGGTVKLDAGFKRFIFDLSPELVANRAVRNDFILHPQIRLSSGWRVRGLAEIGPVTSAGESNARYNSEFTVGRKLGKASELYSTYGTLHYAKTSAAGYFSPDLVQNIVSGWNTDVDRKSVSLSLDFAAGAGHAKNHGADYGPWGLSVQAQSYVTWTLDSGNEVRASYEFYYDQSNPAIATESVAGAWHMSVVTFSFHWRTKK
jgi:hypothetical protein